MWRILCGTKQPPLGESSGAIEFKILSAVEVSFLVEMVVNRRMNSDELLQTSHTPEP
jgi:hypothetical protein